MNFQFRRYKCTMLISNNAKTQLPWVISQTLHQMIQVGGLMGKELVL
jgi:hypothetical protein